MFFIGKDNGQGFTEEMKKLAARLNTARRQGEPSEHRLIGYGSEPYVVIVEDMTLHPNSSGSVPNAVIMGGALMRHLRGEVQLALDRLMTELGKSDAVISVHSQKIGTEMHVWVVLREWSRAARDVVYEAQLTVDPEFLLEIHLEDSADEVPADAELMGVMRA